MAGHNKNVGWFENETDIIFQVWITILESNETDWSWALEGSICWAGSWTRFWEGDLGEGLLLGRLRSFVIELWRWCEDGDACESGRGRYRGSGVVRPWGRWDPRFASVARARVSI